MKSLLQIILLALIFAKSSLANIFFDASVGRSITKTKLVILNELTLKERILEDKDTNTSFNLGLGKRLKNFENSNFGLHFGLNLMFNGYGTFHDTKEDYNVRSFRSTFLYLGTHYSLEKLDFYARAGLAVNHVGYERTFAGFLLSMMTLFLVDFDGSRHLGLGGTLGMGYKIDNRHSIFIEGNYVFSNDSPSRTFHADLLKEVKTSSGRIQAGYRIFF